MLRALPQPFKPPSAAQVRSLLERNPPREASRALMWVPLIALSLAVALAMSAQGAAALLLPWVFLGIFYGFLAWRGRGARSVEHDSLRVQDLIIARKHADSLRQAWKLLPRVATQPELYARAIAAIGLNLDRLGAYEAAIVAYDGLLAHMPEQHPVAIQFRIQRAMAHLADDQLLDADNALRKLRGTADAQPGSPTAAYFRLAVLSQQTATGHYEDALASEAALIEELRVIGIDAGFGYALMALSLRNVADARVRNAERAAEDARRRAFHQSNAAPIAQPTPSRDAAAPNANETESPTKPADAAYSGLPQDQPQESHGDPTATNAGASDPASPHTEPVPAKPAPIPGAAERERAALWWSRATLLLPVDRLLQRTPALRAMLDEPAPAERLEIIG